MGWWVADLLESNPALLVSWAVWVIGSIVLHELAHGWAAIRCGDRTPIELGHMTWNPVVHMGGMSLIIFFVIGIAWGAMPVNPSRFKGRHDEAIVAAAGPAMNLGLALLAIILAGVWSTLFAGVGGDPFHGNVFQFFWVGAMLNLVLMALNLLPVPPLDGSRILASFSWTLRQLFANPQAQFATLALLMLLFITGGFGQFFAVASTVADAGINLVQTILPGGP
ncbi:MAG: site-2 protease family protein [Phycisphaeraceae bacterium]|nr:MAG: site-2 protease family protein [Phycisphaeraceae bacterium]